jgi:hypothetical protein
MIFAQATLFHSHCILHSTIPYTQTRANAQIASKSHNATERRSPTISDQLGPGGPPDFEI